VSMDPFLGTLFLDRIPERSSKSQRTLKTRRNGLCGLNRGHQISSLRIWITQYPSHRQPRPLRIQQAQIQNPRHMVLGNQSSCCHHCRRRLLNLKRRNCPHLTNHPWIGKRTYIPTAPLARTNWKQIVDQAVILVRLNSCSA
jgi:hypothetical protein